MIFVTSKRPEIKKIYNAIQQNFKECAITNVKDFDPCQDYRLVYLNYEISDAQTLLTEDDFCAWADSVYQPFRVVLLINKRLLVNICLKQYAITLQSYMMPGTVVFTSSNSDQWLTMLSTRSSLNHLKPSLANSGRGHCITKNKKVAIEFIRRNLDRVPSGVVISQPHHRNFMESKFVLHGSRIVDNVYPIDCLRYVQSIAPTIIEYFGSLGMPVAPDVWRIDVVHGNEHNFYLNEIEIVGAEYKFITKEGLILDFRDDVAQSKIQSIKKYQYILE